MSTAQATHCRATAAGAAASFSKYDADSGQGRGSHGGTNARSTTCQQPAQRLVRVVTLLTRQRLRQPTCNSVHRARVQRLLQVGQLLPRAQAALLHCLVRRPRKSKLPQVLAQNGGLPPGLAQTLAAVAAVHEERLLHGALPLGHSGVHVLKLETPPLLSVPHLGVCQLAGPRHAGLLHRPRLRDLPCRALRGHLGAVLGLPRARLGRRDGGIAGALRLADAGVGLLVRVLQQLRLHAPLLRDTPALLGQELLQSADPILVLRRLLDGQPLDAVDLVHRVSLYVPRLLLRDVPVGLHDLRRLAPTIDLGVLVSHGLPVLLLCRVLCGLQVPKVIVPALRLWHHRGVPVRRQSAAASARHGATHVL
mmetsp:Transcript_122824/g.342242  ORF Transcript_122824/g.342242 Transcript_122824/m.342242 type:complete len:365 (-) Transcript_122824:75-1169(-)